MLVVDLMHEFELGVWKSVLLHLIRMLYTLGKDSVNEFNLRYDTIFVVSSSHCHADTIHKSQLSVYWELREVHNPKLCVHERHGSDELGGSDI